MDLVLRTTVVLVLAFVLAGILRRATPATRHLLWHVTMLIVVLAPALHLLTPRIPLPAWLTSTTLMSAGPALLGPAEAVPSTIATKAAPSEGAFGTAEAVPSTIVENLPRSSGILIGGHRFSGARMALPVSPLAIWAAGSFLVGAWFAVGWLAAAWIARRAAPASVSLEADVRVVARDLHVTPAPKVRLMASSRGPMTVGLLHPTVLLPAIATEWDAPRRRAILAHELAHVRRADMRTQALTHVACALYWFNPLVWMAGRALRRERERACDDEVVALGIRPSTYAQDLLDVARVMTTRFAPSAAIAMARRSELEGRLLSLLASDRRRRPARLTRWALPMAMGLAAAIALGGQSGAARTVDAPSTTAARPPAAALFNADEHQGGARQRERSHGDADTLRRSRDESARERAALSLALLGGDTATKALIAALDDPSSQVREKAAMGLALRTTPDVIEPLIRALGDANAQVREKAAAGLMLRRDPRVLDALLVAITDVDGQVREKAAIALGTSGDARASAALERATHDRDPQVREKAVAGLALLRGLE